MQYIQLFSEYEEKLAEVGEETESLTFTFRGLKQLNFTDFLLLLRQEVSKEDEVLIKDIFTELSNHRPAQYILGYSYFCGLELAVDERVLIPRPETEELVQLILDENQGQSLRVLDIGTGSGAIAIALAYARPDWQISGADISTAALEVATKNAQQHQATIHFIHSDVCQSITGQYDIIVSNPPYISWEDTDEVGLNVFNAEPHLALFADEDGLSIYRKIAEQAVDFLSPEGKIYLEIGYKQGEAIRSLFKQVYPTKRIRILQDSYGKDRMVVIDE